MKSNVSILAILNAQIITTMRCLYYLHAAHLSVNEDIICLMFVCSSNVIGKWYI